MFERINFQDNNGNAPIFFEKDDKSITIDYEYNAFNRLHLFTIENNNFRIEKATAVAGGILNYQGINICNLFVVVHCPLMNGLLGYADEFTAGSALLYVLDKEELEKYIKNYMSVLDK